jgi:hypothetical protein
MHGNVFPSIAPNDWWFGKLNMWHESLWFYNPKATFGSGATPAHQPAAFYDETCHADMLFSYDEHMYRPMIPGDQATGGEKMLSKPVRRSRPEVPSWKSCSLFASRQRVVLVIRFPDSLGCLPQQS